ncbi:hypothetical protein [Hymenobacter lapidiphilus]|uniref:hypothetical protein n=1 Tax=Hymenobacter sp. CCM 8763 TaxID=2303334 RepID=UPI0011C18EA6|nr:hypothetical protein [Hymenobacter sp. CCM 8763]
MKADVSVAHVLPPPGSHRLLIKNMVCPQCIQVVGEDLAALGLQVHRVALGEADASTPDGAAPDWAAIRSRLQDAGFVLLEDPRDQLVDRIKTLLVALIHYPPARPAAAQLLRLSGRAPGEGLPLPVALILRFRRPDD